MLVFPWHVHSQSFSCGTSRSTMETYNSTSTYVLCLTVVLHMMLVKGAELAIKALPQPIRIPSKALLNQFIQSCIHKCKNCIKPFFLFKQLCAFWSSAWTGLSWLDRWYHTLHMVLLHLSHVLPQHGFVHYISYWSWSHIVDKTTTLKRPSAYSAQSSHPDLNNRFTVKISFYCH